MAETFVSSLKGERNTIIALAKTVGKFEDESFRRFNELISDQVFVECDSEDEEVSCRSGYFDLYSIVKFDDFGPEESNGSSQSQSTDSEPLRSPGVPTTKRSSTDTTEGFIRQCNTRMSTVNSKRTRKPHSNIPKSNIPSSSSTSTIEIPNEDQASRIFYADEFR